MIFSKRKKKGAVEYGAICDICGKKLSKDGKTAFDNYFRVNGLLGGLHWKRSIAIQNRHYCPDCKIQGLAEDRRKLGLDKKDEERVARLNKQQIEFTNRIQTAVESGAKILEQYCFGVSDEKDRETLRKILDEAKEHNPFTLYGMLSYLNEQIEDAADCLRDYIKYERANGRL